MPFLTSHPGVLPYFMCRLIAGQNFIEFIHLSNLRLEEPIVSTTSLSLDFVYRIVIWFYFAWVIGCVLGDIRFALWSEGLSYLFNEALFSVFFL